MPCRIPKWGQACSTFRVSFADQLVDQSERLVRMTKRVKCQSPDQELAKNADTVIPIPSITGSQASFEKACRLFHETRFKVNCFAAAELVWDRILTESQRRSLGSTLVAALRDHHNTVGMWRHLYQVSYQRAVIDLGEKVGFLSSSDVDWLLREGGDLPRSPEEAFQEAIRRGYLVIARESRSIFWKGEIIECDWFKNNESWTFLIIACEQALQNRSIDRFLFGARAAENVVTKKKSRLMQQVPHFPVDLYDAFVSVGRGTQRFNLPANQIHFFDNE